jgi:hypothetical protein
MVLLCPKVQQHLGEIGLLPEIVPPDAPHHVRAWMLSAAAQAYNPGPCAITSSI